MLLIVSINIVQPMRIGGRYLGVQYSLLDSVAKISPSVMVFGIFAQ